MAGIAGFWSPASPIITTESPIRTGVADLAVRHVHAELLLGAERLLDEVEHAAAPSTTR